MGKLLLLAIYIEIVNPKKLLRAMPCLLKMLFARTRPFSWGHTSLSLLFWLQGSYPSDRISCVLTYNKGDALMATVVPHSQLVAKAVEYILAKLGETPQASLTSLID